MGRLYSTECRSFEGTFTLTAPLFLACSEAVSARKREVANGYLAQKPYIVSFASLSKKKSMRIPQF